MKQHLLKAIFACLWLMAVLAAYANYYYDTPGPLPEPKTVILRKGQGFRGIVDNLAKEGVISQPLIFKMIAAISGDGRKFKPGEYAFTAAITPKLVIDMIAAGRVVVHKITIPEGLTSTEIIALLNNEKILEGEIGAIAEEGSLLPETYHYTYGDLRQDIILRMQAGMTQALAELWEKRRKDLPLADPRQAVTLASIIEKETGVASERGLVASVFVNRLKKGMKLQSDPTVIYGIEKEKGPLKRALLLSDLAYDSAYNTYKYEGLPPGPIANPGRASLEAALNPPSSDYLYFVATGTGGHHFSGTLKGHNDNVREYKKVKTAAKKPKD